MQRTCSDLLLYHMGRKVYMYNNSLQLLYGFKCISLSSLDMFRPFICVSGRNLIVVKKYIQRLIACVFNVILHLQSSLIFYERFTQSKDDSDPYPGTVILMFVDVLARISGKHAIYKMDIWHVAHSLRIPSALFSRFLSVKTF
ncbi:hypothetical protein RchiOBHm_Chr6g0244891 [Rosa chinensis]|uniref:Uncharacterized protein n=1 Tax=Rosa chinensis TaxID=74649 RepID=A0A2P6PJ43_ROSCH|nr:hypothetical protein RchiOBHm_Chr6g0244891 [Rosa chinensis]